MTKKATLMVLPMLLAAACGGGDSGGGGKAAGSDGGVVTAQATADKIGCSGFEADAADSRELFVADSGTCQLDGHKLTVYRFSNNEARDNWIKTATQFGIGRFVVVDRGVVTSDNQQDADKVKDKIGGDIRT